MTPMPAALETMGAGTLFEFMAMPAGLHAGSFGQGAKAVRRTVNVEPAAAVALNDQLKAIYAAREGKQRAYFDFDHMETGPASGWPVEFFWKEGEPAGVYCRAELSQAGADAIKGREYRNFSPVFYVTRGDPAKVYCRQDADLCMGSLVNKPAFHEIEPLWAKEAPSAEPEPISAAGAAVTTENQNKGQNSMPEKETAVAANNTQAADDALKAGDTKITTLESENAALKASDAKRRKRDAEAAVGDAIKRGAIPAQDEPLKARWTGLIEENPDNVVLLAALPDNPALTGGSVTRGQDGGTRLEAREGGKRVMQHVAQLCARQSRLVGNEMSIVEGRREVANQVAALYAHEIKDKEVLDMPLRAADYTDPAGNLGTLTGTLVAQRTLELFKYQFPALTRVSTDFSDMPAQFGQSIATRILSVPAITTYDTTLGWTTPAGTPTSTDVLVSLNEHVGVPIRFNANTLASTMRRLFDEFAPAASYALGKYFVDKIYKLFTLANFNAYAAKSATVPTAYATYAVGLGDFARSHLVKISAAMNVNLVPLHDRIALLNSAYFGQLATDPSLTTFFAGQQAPGMITDNELPKMATFQPIEAPNMPTTANLVGIALQKAGIVAVTRLSNDYTQALPGSSYGSVQTITNPDTGISVVLVQYVDHKLGFAEWRIQVMLGAAVGDNRAGLLITSQ